MCVRSVCTYVQMCVCVCVYLDRNVLVIVNLEGTMSSEDICTPLFFFWSTRKLVNKYPSPDDRIMKKISEQTQKLV